jgi:hypothetical protein
LQFTHKPEHAELAAALEMVMADEHPGPRFPGPLPPAEHDFPSAPLKNVRDRVTNYSQEKLEELAPSVHITNNENGQCTVAIVNGLTQESFLPTSHELVQDGEEVDAPEEEEVNVQDDEDMYVQDEEKVNVQDEEDVYVQDEEEVNVQDEEEVNVQDEEEVNIFAESLHPNLSQLNNVANHSTRDLLKAPMNKLIQCLDCLKSTAMNEKGT